MTEEEFRSQVKAGVIKHVGLPESVAMVADSLNLPVDEITETIEPKIATERVQTEYLTVEAGQAAGVHQIARGLSGGKELDLPRAANVRRRKRTRRYSCLKRPSKH